MRPLSGDALGAMADDLGGTDPVPAWQALLREVAELRRRADLIEYRAIELVRESGVTWEDIGEALGISRQAARERFGKPRQRRKRLEKRGPDAGR